MTKDTMIGVDLAKSVFQLHDASMTGQPKYRKKLSRQGFTEFMSKQPPAIVVLEACGSAHHWAHEMSRLGHEVKLIATQYVKPFVKRQKNDAADAEAIVIAAQRPEMRFVEPKSRCLIPRFDGAILSLEWKEGAWDKFVTAAPSPSKGLRTPSGQEYSVARNAEPGAGVSTRKRSRNGVRGRRSRI